MTRKWSDRIPIKDVIPNPRNPESMILARIAQQVAAYLEEQAAGTDASIMGGISDSSLPVEGGEPIIREPEYFISPVSKTTRLPVKLVEVEDDMGTRLVREWVVVEGLRCKRCGYKKEMLGWNLDAPPGHPNRVVQCPNCRLVHWMKSGDARTQDA